MTNELPDPLVSAEVDLRGYEFMPFYGERCFKSATWIGCTAEAKIAALRLWWHAYANESPAASLPDDDVLLSEYAGYGMMVKAWRKVRPQAMRGFILCNDGRLYHKYLSEIALTQWEFRKKQRDRTESARKARLSQSALTQQKRSVTDSVTDPPNSSVTEPVTTSVTESRGEERRGERERSTSKPLAPSGFALEAGKPSEKRVNGHDPTPVIERIPLVGEREFEIHTHHVTELERAYPAVDVPQTLREIRVWCLANPQRRKTEKGALRFVNSWMAREQNRG